MRVRLDVGVVEINIFVIDDDDVSIEINNSVFVSTDKKLIDNFNIYSKQLLEHGYLDLSEFKFHFVKDNG